MIPNTQHSEDITKIAAALGSALPKMEAATKDSKNPHFNSKYADLSAVMDACKPHLAAQGIVVMQPPATTEDGGAVSVSTVLLHNSGQWIASTLTLRPTKQDPQGMGSAITYARRYSLQSMLGIPAEDDDGNAASGTGSKDAAKAVADRKIAHLRGMQNDPVTTMRNQATPKPAGAVTEDLLKAYLRRAAKSPAEASAVYAEICGKLERIGGQDLADQCWAQTIAKADPIEAPNEVVTLLYRALRTNQEPAA
jgi:hypothetical protein